MSHSVEPGENVVPPFDATAAFEQPADVAATPVVDPTVQEVQIPKALLDRGIGAEEIESYGFDPTNPDDVRRFTAVFNLGRMAGSGASVEVIAAAREEGRSAGYAEGYAAAEEAYDADDDDDEEDEDRDDEDAEQHVDIGTAVAAAAAEERRANPKQWSEAHVEKMAGRAVDSLGMRLDYYDEAGDVQHLLNERGGEVGDYQDGRQFDAPRLGDVASLVGREGATQVLVFETIPGHTYGEYTGITGSKYADNEVVHARYLVPQQFVDGRVATLHMTMPTAWAEVIEGRANNVDLNPEFPAALMAAFLENALPVVAIEDPDHPGEDDYTTYELTDEASEIAAGVTPPLEGQTIRVISNYTGELQDTTVAVPAVQPEGTKPAKEKQDKEKGGRGRRRRLANIALRGIGGDRES